jgi:hypothetical protein
MKISCAFNIFIQPLPGTLEGSENHNPAEIRQTQISPKLTSDQPLVHYGQTI